MSNNVIKTMVGTDNLVAKRGFVSEYFSCMMNALNDTLTDNSKCEISDKCEGIENKWEYIAGAGKGRAVSRVSLYLNPTNKGDEKYRYSLWCGFGVAPKTVFDKVANDDRKHNLTYNTAESHLTTYDFGLVVEVLNDIQRYVSVTATETASDTPDSVREAV